MAENAAEVSSKLHFPLVKLVRLKLTTLFYNNVTYVVFMATSTSTPISYTTSHGLHGNNNTYISHTHLAGEYHNSHPSGKPGNETNTDLSGFPCSTGSAGDTGFSSSAVFSCEGESVKGSLSSEGRSKVAAAGGG